MLAAFNHDMLFTVLDCFGVCYQFIPVKFYIIDIIGNKKMVRRFDFFPRLTSAFRSSPDLAAAWTGRPQHTAGLTSAQRQILAAIVKRGKSILLFCPDAATFGCLLSALVKRKIGICREFFVSDNV